MSFFVLLLGGILLGLMTSVNGLLASYLNIAEISLIVHLIGAVMLVLYIKFRKEKIQLKGAPPYVYLVGVLGVALVATGSICAKNLGATLTMALSVTGQMAVAALIDHFGLFNTKVFKFSRKRIPAYGVMLAGLLLMVYA